MTAILMQHGLNPNDVALSDAQTFFEHTLQTD